MKEVKNILNTNRWFVYPYVTLLAFSIIVLLFMEKNSIQLLINKLNNTAFDFVFKYATMLVEGLSISAVIILTLFIRYRWAAVVSFALILSTIVVYTLKKLIFFNVERPSVFFSQLSDWHTVNGVHLHTHQSFPSGHTAAAFALFFGLAICLKNKKLGVLLFVLGFAVAYSRMYLSQHYLRDVVIGSVIGIIITLFSYFLIQKSNRINQISWIDKSLLQLLSK